MAPKVHFLTPEGRRRLEEELQLLVTVKRKQVADDLRSAREGGDLSENAGYEESKRQQAFVEGRIQELEAILSNAQVLEVNACHDVVALGTHVTVAEEGGDAETYRIVGQTESDPLAGRISNESPLGAALLGKEVGDRVQVQTPDGILYFHVLAIR